MLVQADKGNAIMMHFRIFIFIFCTFIITVIQASNAAFHAPNRCRNALTSEYVGPYLQEMKGAMTRVWLIQRSSDGMILAHRIPLEDTPAHWEALQHQSNLLDAIDPQQTHSFLPKNYGRVKFNDTERFEMEFVKGTDYRQLLFKQLTDNAKGYAIRTKIFLFRFLQMATALKKLQDLYVIHGDVKPENFVLSDEGVIKIMDFAGSVYLNPAGNKVLPPFAQITKDYAAPQLLKSPLSESDFTPSIDWHALGVSMDQLLVDSMKGPALRDVESQPQDHLPDWNEAKKIIDRFRNEILAKLTSNNPADRPKDPLSLIQSFKDEIDRMP